MDRESLLAMDACAAATRLHMGSWRVLPRLESLLKLGSTYIGDMVNMGDDSREPPQLMGQFEGDLADAREVLDLQEGDEGARQGC